MRRGNLLVVAVLGVALLAPRPAAAFWPFTRSVPAPADTLGGPALDGRFADWESGKAGAPADTAGAPADTTGAPAAAAGADTSGTAAPDTTGTSPASQPQAAADTTSAEGDSTTAAGAPPASPPPVTPSGAPALTPAQVAAMDAVGFTPKLDSKLTSSNDRMALTSGLSTTFTDPSGISVTSSLSFNEDISMSVGSDTKTHGIVNGFSIPFRRRGLEFRASTNNTRRSTVGGRTASNVRTTDASEDKGAAASLLVGRPLDRIPLLRRLGVVRGTSANAYFTRNFNSGEQNTVVAAGVGSGRSRTTSTGNAFGGGLSFDRAKWMTLKARAGHLGSAHVLRAQGSPDDERTSEGDTATVDLTLPPHGRILQSATASFRVSRGSRVYLDQARSRSGSPLGLGQKTTETERSFSRSVNLALKLKPLQPVDLTLSLAASRDSVGYAVRPNAFRDTRRLSWKADSKLTFWKDAAFIATFESNRNDIDQDEERNPANALTHVDDVHRLYLEANKSLTTTMKLRAYYEVQLDQSFYLHEGPRGFGDLDQLRTRVGADFSGSIGPGVTMQLVAYARSDDKAYIDPRQSFGSTREEEYVVRPSYTWKVRSNLSVSQSFGLSSRVQDGLFDPSKDTLSRNHFLNTRMDYQFSGRVQVSASYDYLLQDNGDYTREAGFSQRFYTPKARTKKDGIGLGMRYDVLPGGKLTVVSRQDETRERLFRFNDAPPTITERGNLALGIESKLKVRDLDLTCRLNRNQSSNVQLNRNVYYNVDATVLYTF